MFAQPLTLSPIGIVHSPYKEKFSVPRQPNLVQDGVGMLRLLPPYNQPEAVRGLEAFSHLWLIFQFDKIPQGKWQPTVRPPASWRKSTGGRICLACYPSPQSFRAVESCLAEHRN